MKRCEICQGTNFAAQGERPTARCTGCGSLERHRALVTLLEKLADPPPVGRCLEVAPLNQRVYGEWLRRRGWSYTCTDKWRTGNPNDPRAVGFIDYEADLSDLFMFSAHCFELVIVQHVIEEIPDYWRALTEISRVLAPGGVALLEIPYDPARARSLRTPPNHFGNVWQFGAPLIDDLRSLLPDTTIAPFSEGQFRGELFVARHDRGASAIELAARRRSRQTVYVAHGHDRDFARNLELLLATLRTEGTPVLTPDEFLAGKPGALLTFDDGHRNDLAVALPILQRHDAHAISFLIPWRDDLTPRVEDWERWRAAAPWIEIGAHSLTHAQVGTSATGEADPEGAANRLRHHGFGLHAPEPALAAREWLAPLGRFESSGEQLQRRAAEVGFARQVIERKLGRPVRFFAYPWGAWDGSAVQLVQQAGYEAAFSTHRTDGGRFTIPRIDLPTWCASHAVPA